MLDASNTAEEGKFALYIHLSLVIRSFQMDGAILGRALNSALNLRIHEEAHAKSDGWDEAIILAVFFHVRLASST